MLNASNNAQTRLTQSINNSQTEIMVEDVSLFPQPPFVITINNEIMLVTDTNGVALTVERGQENTVATGHFADTVVEHRWTAGMYNKVKREVEDVDDDLQTHKAESATDDVHGLSGKVIEESGSNDNGEYIKFSDGTMICTRETNPIRTNETGRYDYDYPNDFLTVYYTNISGVSNWVTPYDSRTNKARASVFSGHSDRGWVVIKYSDAGSTNDTGVTYRLIAVGKWFE